MEIYDQLDYFICRELTYYFSHKERGDFKIHIGQITIEKEGRVYKIKRPPTFIKDILRFTINEFNNIVYAFYSVKTSLSVLGKVMRDFSIDGEKEYYDPLNKKFIIPLKLEQQPQHLIEKITQYGLSSFYYNEDQANYWVLFNLIFQNQNEKYGEFNSDLSILLTTAIELRELENKAYEIIAKLEQNAFLSDVELVDENISYATIYERYQQKLKKISNGFDLLYQNFLQSRKNKKLEVGDYINLVIPKVPFSKRWFNRSFLHEIKTKPELEKKISNALDCFYLSILGQLDTISSTRRHFLRAISMVLNSIMPEIEEFKKFKQAAKNLEKYSFLLFKGFASKDKRTSYLGFVNFLNAHKKAFDTAIALLTYIESLRLKEQKKYYQLADVKKVLIFYILYISYWDVKFLKRGISLFKEAGILFYKNKAYQNLDRYIGVIEKLTSQTKSLFEKFGFFEKNEPFKQNRKKIVKELKKEITSIKKLLPIHNYLVNLRYSIYESHTNYKFGPWFDAPKTGDMFNPAMLLVSAFCLLNKAKGEKLSYKEKIKLIESFLDKKTVRRTAELAAHLGKKLNKKIISHLSAAELEEIKKIEPIPFGKWKLSQINKFSEEVYVIYEKLSYLHQNLFEILDRISNKYLKKNILDYIFPTYAASFFFYERDILDQLQLKNREQSGFTNKELVASVKIEPTGKGKNFHQKLIIEIDKNTFNFDFKGKDPNRLRFNAAPQDIVFGERIELNSKEIFSFLTLMPDILNGKNYYLNKIFEASTSRYTIEHLNLFLALVKDSTSNEKGVIVSCNYEDKIRIYEFPSLHLKPKFNLTKSHISSKYYDLFEKERILFLRIKQAMRIFEAKNPLVNTMIKQLQKKLYK